MINVLVLTSDILELSKESKTKLKALSSNLKINFIESDKDYSKFLKKAEIIFGWPNIELLKKAKKLKWLHLPSAGAVRYADKSIYLNKEIVLTNSSGVYGKPIAEHVFSLILAHNQNLINYAADKKEKKWQPKNETKDFFDSTVGILGLGDIGSEIAKRAKALEAEVLALKRTMIEAPTYVDQIFLQKDLKKLLKKSDYLVITLPGTPETEAIIGKDELKIMKNSAFIVNIGRGSLIKEQALVTALEKDWISGAGLDVTETEPLPETSPLWDFENVIITPHVSGFSPSNYKRYFAIFKDNLKKYLNNEELVNQVDFELKY